MGRWRRIHLTQLALPVEHIRVAREFSSRPFLESLKRSRFVWHLILRSRLITCERES
jgi:hypothetical protein